MTPAERAVQPDRVLFLIDHFRNPRAGTEGQLYLLVSELIAGGTQCHLVVLSASEYLERNGFPCSWSALGHTSLGSPSTWLAMRRLGRDKAAEGYRLAHTFFNDVSIIAPPMLALSGIKTLISRRDMGFWYTRRSLALLRVTRFWIAGCISNSHAVADITSRRERIPPHKLTVIHNGLEERTPSSNPTPELQTLHNRGRVLAGIVANIRPIKRVDDLIGALAEIRHEAPQLDVVVIGDGNHGELRQQAKALGVEGRVHFLGARVDVPACLNQLDIGVLCSESEGFSNALVEYMLAGLPSICTDSGGNPEAIEDRRSGFLYPVGNKKALSRLLLALARDSGLRKRIGMRARQRAREKFTIKSMVDAHCEVYRRVLSSS